MPTWRCHSESCGTHRSPEHRCPVGRWYCSRVIPACPGHPAGQPGCTSGHAFDCGALYCTRRHRERTDTCTEGPWYCGQTSPPCNGHSGSGPEHCHGAGAIRLHGALLRQRRASTALAQAVTQILRDGDLRRIQFEIRGERVNGALFTDTACQIAAGTVTVRRIGVGALDGTVADYRIGANVMEVPNQLTQTTDKATVVHEAVHLMADLAGRHTADSVTHEAAAFIAGAWYYQIKTGATETDSPRASAAHRVVQAYRQRRTPPDADIQALIEQVQRNYSGTYDFDGIDGEALCIHSRSR